MKVIFGVIMAFLLHSPAISAANDFNQIFTLQGISFHITCPNSGSINQLTIKPSGLKIDNSIIEQEIDGTVSGLKFMSM